MWMRCWEEGKEYGERGFVAIMCCVECDTVANRCVTRLQNVISSFEEF